MKCSHCKGTGKAPSSFTTYKEYVSNMALTKALFWFIENINEDDPDRTAWFFYLRERYQKEG